MYRATCSHWPSSSDSVSVPLRRRGPEDDWTSASTSRLSHMLSLIPSIMPAVRAYRA